MNADAALRQRGLPRDVRLRDAHASAAGSP